jgi:hypothetical protein
LQPSVIQIRSAQNLKGMGGFRLAKIAAHSATQPGCARRPRYTGPGGGLT